MRRRQFKERGIRMRKKVKGFAVGGIFLMVIGAMVGLSHGEDILLGAVYPFTGNLAVQGNAAFNGADIAREMLNEKGGVLGKQVVFEKVDAPNPTAATNETQRFISQK